MLFQKVNKMTTSEKTEKQNEIYEIKTQFGILNQMISQVQNSCYIPEAKKQLVSEYCREIENLRKQIV